MPVVRSKSARDLSMACCHFEGSLGGGGGVTHTQPLLAGLAAGGA